MRRRKITPFMVTLPDEVSMVPPCGEIIIGGSGLAPLPKKSISGGE
jgi:hypothetical protein